MEYCSSAMIPYIGIGYISHHGILGMKWGFRNGPPYPLDSKISTGDRLKKKSGSTMGGDAHSQSERISKKNKKKKLRKKIGKIKKRVKSVTDSIMNKLTGKRALSAEQAEALRTKTINNGSAKDVLKYMNTLTPQERASILARLRDEQMIRDYATKEGGGSAFDRAEQASYKIKRIGDTIDRGSNAYNSAAAVANAFADADMPIITKKAKKNQDADKNDGRIAERLIDAYMFGMGGSGASSKKKKKKKDEDDEDKD